MKAVFTPESPSMTDSGQVSACIPVPDEGEQEEVTEGVPS